MTRLTVAPLVTEEPMQALQGEAFFTLFPQGPTLAQTFYNDTAAEAYARECDAELMKPLGISGVVNVYVKLIDGDADTDLGRYVVNLVHATSAWDVVRALAQRWAHFPITGPFRVVSISYRPRAELQSGLVVPLLSLSVFALTHEGSTVCLSEPQLALLPYEWHSQRA